MPGASAATRASSRSSGRPRSAHAVSKPERPRRAGARRPRQRRSSRGVSPSGVERRRRRAGRARGGRRPPPRTAGRAGRPCRPGEPPASRSTSAAASARASSSRHVQRIGPSTIAGSVTTPARPPSVSTAAARRPTRPATGTASRLVTAGARPNSPGSARAPGYRGRSRARQRRRPPGARIRPSSTISGLAEQVVLEQPGRREPVVERIGPASGGRPRAVPPPSRAPRRSRSPSRTAC